MFDLCEEILQKMKKPEQMIFMDESNVELGSFTKDSIRLDPEKKKWDQETYKLINRPQKKFEKSIAMSGGINYYGLGKLIFFGRDDESIFLWINTIILQRSHR